MGVADRDRNFTLTRSSGQPPAGEHAATGVLKADRERGCGGSVGADQHLHPLGVVGQDHLRLAERLATRNRGDEADLIQMIGAGDPWRAA